MPYHHSTERRSTIGEGVHRRRTFLAKGTLLEVEVGGERAGSVGVLRTALGEGSRGCDLVDSRDGRGSGGSGWIGGLDDGDLGLLLILLRLVMKRLGSVLVVLLGRKLLVVLRVVLEGRGEVVSLLGSLELLVVQKFLLALRRERVVHGHGHLVGVFLILTHRLLRVLV